ncbi:uncharacterized protein, partial [Diabrotica undecimpunctata]|uniref:uncharacterized protein n=1 Tax=Diabrotica undecimpunctata TaxID=50387 RepID=UPI003B636425
QVVRIFSLIEDGRSQRYVANLVGLKQSTVPRVVVRYRETGLYERRAVTGRPRATTHVDNRFLVLQALCRRHVTASQVQHDLVETRNVRVSTETVRHILRQSGIRARVAVTAPRLTREHRIARLTFAREHINWNIDDWETHFTDLITFNIPFYTTYSTRWYSVVEHPDGTAHGGSAVIIRSCTYHIMYCRNIPLEAFFQLLGSKFVAGGDWNAKHIRAQDSQKQKVVIFLKQ